MSKKFTVKNFSFTTTRKTWVDVDVEHLKTSWSWYGSGYLTDIWKDCICLY